MVIAEIIPDKSLMPKLWAQWYTIAEAIAELIDNSLDARIDDEPMKIDVTNLPDEITVMDNWSGMDFEGLKKALTLAKTNKVDGKLWHYGLWLKTACLWLWKRFRIRTTKRGEGKEYMVEFDEDKRKQSDKWEVDIQENDISYDNHYTKVEVSNLKWKNIIKDDKIVKWIQERFSHFLNEITINVNNVRVEPKPIKVIESSKVYIDKLYWNWKYRLTWWVWLMEKSKQNGDYWIHCYKWQRLIVPFNKIWFDPHATLWKIFWEINMNNVETTHDKRAFEVESPEYMEVEQILRNELKGLVKEARDSWWKAKETKEVEIKKNAWNKDTGKAISQVVKTIEQKWWTVEIPKRDVIKIRKTLEWSWNEITKEVREVIAKKDSWELRKHEIEFAWKKLYFTHSYEHLWAEQSWKIWKFDSENNIINIYTNKDFPVYFACNDLPFLATIHVAESLTEFLLEWKMNENSLDDFMKIYIAILRISSNLKEDFIEE